MDFMSTNYVFVCMYVFYNWERDIRKSQSEREENQVNYEIAPYVKHFHL